MKEKRNILYLTYDGLTDPLGGSQILPYLIGLSSSYNITVISFEKKSAFIQYSSNIEEVIEGKIKWIPKQYLKWPPVVSTLYNLVGLWYECKLLSQDNHFHIVHCRSYITSLIGLWFKSKFKSRFVFDMRGFWADERVEGGIWNLRNPIFALIYKYFKHKELEFIHEADHVVVLTEKAKQILKSWGRNHAVSVIPCCVDTDFFTPYRVEDASKLSIRQSLNLKSNEFVLTYIGSLGTWYMLNEMLDFFKSLKLLQEDAKFLILTGELKDTIYAVAEERGVKTTDLIIKRVQRNEMPIYISISDFTILFIRNTFSKQGSSPTKLGESLAMGIPVIANAGIGDIDVLFKDGNIGMIIEEFSFRKYQESVKKVLEFKGNILAIRNQAESYLSLNRGIILYSNIYKVLLDQEDDS
ncbi:MAG: glycosyltransferase [Cyclobacteriaceae bacterium]|nr:MAG: glycosyltransferase [Cyclobacteriaceae bacterium]